MKVSPSTQSLRSSMERTFAIMALFVVLAGMMCSSSLAAGVPPAEWPSYPQPNDPIVVPDYAPYPSNAPLATKKSLSTGLGQASLLINRLWQSESWRSNGYKPDAFAEAGYADSNGDLKAIPATVTEATIMFGWALARSYPPNAPLVESWLGEWSLFYEGNGTCLGVQHAAAAISNDVANGVMKIRVGVGGRISNWALSCSKAAFDASNPPKLKGLVHSRHYDDWNAGRVWHSEYVAWLNRWAFRVRSMPQASPDNIDTVEWVNRTLPQYPLKKVSGLPLEFYVELAQRVPKLELWVTFPAGSTADFQTKAAEFLVARLPPDCTLITEWANEAWNYGFKATAYYIPAQARARYGNTTMTEIFSMNSELQTKMAKRFKDVWNTFSGPKAKLKCALGTQTGNFDIARKLLNPTRWAAEPDYIEPASVFDTIAVTCYFGTRWLTKTELRSSLLDHINDTNAYDWYRDQLLSSDTTKDGIANMIVALRRHIPVALQYGLNIDFYEGGQHVFHSAFTNGVPASEKSQILAFMGGFVQSAQMGQVYRSWYRLLRNERIGTGPMQFSDFASATAAYGAWCLATALEDVNSTRRIAIEDEALHIDRWCDITDMDCDSSSYPGPQSPGTPSPILPPVPVPSAQTPMSAPSPSSVPSGTSPSNPVTVTAPDAESPTGEAVSFGAPFLVGLLSLLAMIL